MNKRNTASRKGSERRYHIEMTSWSIFLWVVCLSLLMAWIFVLGIMVGRGFLPESVTAIPHIRSLIDKFQGMAFHSRRSEEGIQRKEDYDPKLAFYHELSNKKDEQKRRGFPEAKQESLKKEPSQKKSEFSREPLPEVTGEISSKEPAVKKKAEASKATGPEVTQKDITESLAKKQDLTSTGGGYALQLASVEERSGAEETIKRLSKRGYSAYYYEVQIRGKTWYRVRCGRFATREEAEEYAKRLIKETGIKGLVTKVE